MGRHWLGGVAAAALTLLASPAVAQDKDELICVTVAHIWGGSTADVARIATNPIPDSFRRTFEAGGCGRFSLVVSSLTEWNLAFGDEASTTAALAYLAADMAPDRDYVADLGKQVAAARAAAGEDPKTGRQSSKAVERLQTLVWRGRSYVELAELYLRAAEFYGSRSLFAKAERYARPALDVQRLRDPLPPAGEAKGTARMLENLEVYEGQADALDMHLAVLRAVLSREDGDVAAARAVMKAKESPFYRQVAEEAFTHGDDFCDTGDRADLEALRKACDDGNFEWKATAWLRMQAQLDILEISLSDDPKAAENLRWRDIASNLFRINMIERAADQAAPSAMERYSGAENEITLRLARADALLRLAALKRGDDDGGNWEPRDLLGQAMAEMIATEPLASPTITPGRFRQIAATYLDAYGKAVALQQKERPGATDLNYPPTDRKAAYFRTMLPLLKAIGEGRTP